MPIVAPVAAPVADLAALFYLLSLTGLPPHSPAITAFEGAFIALCAGALVVAVQDTWDGLYAYLGHPVDLITR